jgi:hypothetical protein
LKEGYDKAGIPVRGWEPDNNWIVTYGGENQHGNGTSKNKNWVGRQWDYEPELYPSGGEDFVSKLGNLSMTYYTNGFNQDNVYGARFSTGFALEDAIGSHACSLQANMRATNSIPLGCPPLYRCHHKLCLSPEGTRASTTWLEKMKWSHIRTHRMQCTVRVFRQKFALEDAIEFHAFAPLEALPSNAIPLGRSLLLPVRTVNCVQTLKVQ